MDGNGRTLQNHRNGSRPTNLPMFSGATIWNILMHFYPFLWSTIVFVILIESTKGGTES